MRGHPDTAVTYGTVDGLQKQILQRYLLSVYLLSHVEGMRTTGWDWSTRCGDQGVIIFIYLFFYCHSSLVKTNSSTNLVP